MSVGKWKDQYRVGSGSLGRSRRTRCLADDESLSKSRRIKCLASDGSFKQIKEN